MNYTSLLPFFCWSLVALIGCKTMAPSEYGQKVTIAESVPKNCINVASRPLQITMGYAVGAPKLANLITYAKNEAIKYEADTVLLEDVVVNVRAKAFVKYFSCQPIARISDIALEKACDNLDTNACVEVALRSQSKKEYSKMLVFFRKACAREDTYSCKWIAEYEIYKSDLKKKCLNNDGKACFVAAKVSDYELDDILLLSFLKQGCSYKHNESCFYLNMVQEEKEKAKERAKHLYQILMVNIQRQLVTEMRYQNMILQLNKSYKK